MDQPVVLDWARNHPVMRFVDLSKVAVEEALRVRPLAAGKTLLESVGGPLIFLLEEPQRKAVFVGFDLFKTDLPLRVAFPLILANSLRWLQPVGLEGSDLMVAAGLALPPVRRARRRRKGRCGTRAARPHRAEITRGALSFAQTDRVGIYTLNTGGKRDVRFAVNLLDGAESNIRPQPLPVAPAADGGRGGGQLHVPAGAVAVPPGAGDADPRPRGVPLLAASDRGAAGRGRLRASDRWALASRVVALAPARLGAHPAAVHPVARPAERLLRARHVRQREPRRAGDGLSVGDVGARGHEGR